ncbi:diguanylate cyclase [Citreimonas salinaria]|uniref:diguanylate cyclase n=1 Tax=Citreimonas salinaria TaxID=321339 RepID=A0A1H3JRD8_9RHOB|nr:diguanylate cyclase [Citreimonas salinaria]SDY41928.1 response regulator receiver modulated diguanylate cyclase [Citreimonas salinaria]
MTGRILIVDSVPTNRIVLRVKLATAYYEVAQAGSGDSALGSLRRTRPDLVIAAGNLPDMSAQTFCASLREHPLGARVPIIVVLNTDDPDDRLASLAAGADDVLARPLDELVLLARLRSLLRARDAEAELALRDDTRRALGLGEQPADFVAPARVMLVPARADAMPAALPDQLRAALPHRVELVHPDDALRDRDPPADVIVLLEAPDAASDALSLLPQLRSATRSRHAAIIYVARPHQRAQAAAALDMGASDLLSAGPEAQELALRITKQAARKQTADRLRANMRDGLRAALIDPLTGLYNRRYVMPHLDRVAERAMRRDRSFALLMLDLDHFKTVNDTLGHPAGDAVLIDLADRLRDNMRAADLVARFGGEEFLIVMPDTTADEALRTGERLGRIIAAAPVVLNDGQRITVTASIGIALGLPGTTMSAHSLIDGADRALYRAKELGRNRVEMAGPPHLLAGPPDALPAPAEAKRALR